MKYMQYDQQSNGATAAVPVIRVWKLSKDYYLGRTVVPALSAVDLEIARGEFVAIMGPSGSGKSTLMNILSFLDRPTSGNYWLDGIPVGEMSTGELADVRNREIGFVFQNFNLLPWMTALANAPSLILADEPTGNLDSRTSMEILTILQRLNARGITVVLVTHEADIASYCSRKVTFRDGRVMQDTVNVTPAMAQERLLRQPPAEGER